jgi:hypothetical protein
MAEHDVLARIRSVVELVFKQYPGFTTTYVGQDEVVQKEILQVLYNQTCRLTHGNFEDEDVLRVLKEGLAVAGRMKYIDDALQYGMNAAFEKWPSLVSLYPANRATQSALDEIVRVLKHTVVQVLAESEYAAALGLITEMEMDALIVTKLEEKFSNPPDKRKQIADAIYAAFEKFPNMVIEYPLSDEVGRQEITRVVIRNVMQQLQSPEDSQDAGMINDMVRDRLDAVKKPEQKFVPPDANPATAHMPTAE